MSSGRFHRRTLGPNRKQRRAHLQKKSSRNRRTTPGRRRQVVYGWRKLYDSSFTHGIGMLSIPVKFIIHTS